MIDTIFNATLPFTYRRDYQFELDAIQCSRIELEIRNHANNNAIRAYMPVAFADDNNPILDHNQVKVHLKKPYAHSPVVDMSLPFPTQRECQPTVTWYHDRYPAVINADPRLNAKFFFLRLGQLYQRLSAPCLSEAFAPSWDAMDRNTGHRLGEYLRITGSWNATTPTDGPWTLTPLSPVHSGINVNGANGIFRYALRMVWFSDSVYAVLPLAFYQHPDYPAGALELFIPPRPPYTLINSQWLHVYPFATVILTDDVQFALTTAPTPHQVVLGNPGGDAWIENLDLQPLLGRRVVCHTDMTENPQKATHSQLLMASKLKTYDINPESCCLTPEPWLSQAAFPINHF